MGILGPLILTTAIGLQLNGRQTSEANDALSAIAKASFISTGLNKKVKRWEKLYIPIPLRTYGAWITTIIKIEHDRMITFEWNF